MSAPRRFHGLLPVVVLIASVVAPLALAQPPGFPRPNVPNFPPPNFPTPPPIPDPPKPPEFQKVWTCSKCGHEWPDTGGPPPSNCPKCGINFINGSGGGSPKAPAPQPNANTPNANVPNAGGMPNAGGLPVMEQQWTCSKCKHAWTTTGTTTPEKCPKCNTFFDKVVNPDGTTTQTRHGRIGTYVGIGTAVVVLIAVGIKAAVSSSSGGSSRPKKKKKKKPVRRPRDDDDDY